MIPACKDFHDPRESTWSIIPKISFRIERKFIDNILNVWYYFANKNEFENSIRGGAQKTLEVEMAKKKAAKKAAKKKVKKAGKKVSKKAVKKVKKVAKKAAKKKVKAKRKPNPAFMRPMNISPALSRVVGSKPIPRTEVTKRVWNYIKKNGLQDKVNRRNINADANLRDIFGGKSTVSMFEMTKLINRHLS